MSHALIIEALRTPRGRGNDKGALRSVKPVDLLAQQFRALSERTGIDTAQVNDAIIGCVTQTSEQGANIAKLALVSASWADSVPGLSINRYCASGLSAVHLAAQQAMAADGLAVGGGVEMMSRVPMASDQGPLTHDFEFQQNTALVPIGISADTIATQEGFSREQCDAYAVSSQQRAVAALAQGRFRSVVPVLDAQGAILLTHDETPRAQTNIESLGTLKPAFAAMGEKYGIDQLLCQRYGLPKIDHVHHAGNSPAMADGASAVLLASPAAAKRLGLHARARILATASVSVDRTLALTGAVQATERALAQAKLKIEDIDLFEVNESFASLMLHFMKHLKVSQSKLNVNGGAIALGHAMGSTGSALVGMVIDELELRQERLAVVTLCGAAGLAVAMVIERV
ncbi:MAG: acetyl-CoA C-acyltransferase [Comamonadaceae bacterium]